MPITFDEKTTLPTYGTPEYYKLQATSTALPETVKGSYDTNTKEISILSGEKGKQTLDEYIAQQKADTEPKAETTPTGDATPAPKVGMGNSVTAEEATATGIDLTKYAYNPDTQLYSPSATNVTDDESRNVISQFDELVKGQEQATQALIQSIKGVYSGMVSEQAEANRRNLAGYNTLGIRGGAGRYAPEIQRGILKAVIDDGLEKIRTIQANEINKIATAEQALTDKKYEIFVKQRQEINELRKERQTELTKIQDRIVAARKRASGRVMLSALSSMRNLRPCGFKCKSFFLSKFLPC